MDKNKYRVKGFSLAEVLIVSSILIFLLIGLMLLYINYSKTYDYQQSLIRTADSARIAMNELQNAVLQSRQIVGTRSFGGTLYSSDQYSLILEIPSMNSSGDIIDDSYDYVVFYTSGEFLYELTETAPGSVRRSGLKQLSDTVETINFTYDNIDKSQVSKINADIQMQTPAGTRLIEYDVRQDIYLRNK